MKKTINIEFLLSMHKFNKILKVDFIINEYYKNYLVLKRSSLVLFIIWMHFIAYSNWMELKVIPATNQDTTKSCDTLYFKSGNFILVQYFEIIGDQIKFIKCDQKDKDTYFLIPKDQLAPTINAAYANAIANLQKPKKSPFTNQYNYASLFWEIVGAAPLLSTNLEYVFRINKDIGVSSRIGIGFAPNFDFDFNFGIPSSPSNTTNQNSNKKSSALEIPIAINLIYGNSIAAEIGYGLTLVSGSSCCRDIYLQGINQHAFIGFRTQKLSNRYLFRCGYTPVWRNNVEIAHFFGLSFGYRFQLVKKGIQEKTINKR